MKKVKNLKIYKSVALYTILGGVGIAGINMASPLNTSDEEMKMVAVSEKPTLEPTLEPTSTPAPTPAPTPSLQKYEEPKYGYVIKSLKLKKGSKIKVPKYQTVKMLGELDNKVLVKYDDKKGYVDANKLVELNDTFVTIDVDKQELRIIEDGKTTLKTSVVTGTETNPSRRSDRGVFEVYSKSADRYLQGPGYSTHVDYFAAYNRGEGLHDACWRSSFGGETYKYDGSHGCINLPVNVAPKVYKKVKIGTKVIVHD